jgi:hypothetical protein
VLEQPNQISGDLRIHTKLPFYASGPRLQRRMF